MTNFADRHIGISAEDQEQMLSDLQYSNLDDLIDSAVPDSIRSQKLSHKDPLSENEALQKIQAYAKENQVFTSLIGTGWNNSFTPAVVRRNMIENPAWYTAYTPYQPEISQGRLEMLLTFQTMISDLTGCELANASMLDEASAAAEAMTMLQRIDKSDRINFFIDESSHPQTIAVIKTRAEPLNINITIGDPTKVEDFNEYFGALITHPASTGELRDIEPVIAKLHEGNTKVAVSTDLLACCLIKPPGECGADVVVGSAQRFGVPMGFGGPHAGFIATSEKNARALPGRLVGVSKDSADRPAYRLTLQTREQHIRREKATSNICTAQALLANVATAYAAWHGPKGLKTIAEEVHNHTCHIADVLNSDGFETSDTFFDTITVKTNGKTQQVLNKCLEAKINLRPIDGNTVGISLDETTTPEIVEQLLAAFDIQEEKVTSSVTKRIPDNLRRTSAFLTHPNFNSFQTEHEMLRWLRKLSDKDLALDRTMIPLGSCTMKLNAAAEMEPITWDAFANIHPYAPVEQTTGYRKLIAELEEALVEITGYHKISLQPNAGSQGEYAGLIAIRKWHESQGESERNICLIPSSAHGTNAASAVLAGMKVVVVKCDDKGNIDIADLDSQIESNKDSLAALMITYPSTHGVYEATVKQVCAKVHAAGGQVYTDGANLNALVGLAKPGEFGSDVSHLNLHKTFCIPHGGGGPGVGPVGVAKHLAPFLPGHPVVEIEGNNDIVIASAPFGSAGILPISWMYIQMMGSVGLTDATKIAVLSANYIAKRLSDYYPILYIGEDGSVAHECIIDIRPITNETGVTNTDIAKRLADYGFHAPTMSFPVPGTLMIEPTESESLKELNRFCEAMIAIHSEISEVRRGEYDIEESVLRNAPHPIQDLIDDNWSRKYSRNKAAYPVNSLSKDKYFPPIGRIDDAHGDRNLNCTCLPVEAYK